jgi:hypothetical protein
MAQWVTEAKRVELLVDDLFSAVQGPQGYFHVSDGETFPTAAELFERTRGRLAYGKDAVKRMEAFLRKHGELRKRADRGGN